MQSLEIKQIQIKETNLSVKTCQKYTKTTLPGKSTFLDILKVTCILKVTKAYEVNGIKISQFKDHEMQNLLAIAQALRYNIGIFALYLTLAYGSMAGMIV